MDHEDASSFNTYWKSGRYSHARKTLTGDVDVIQNGPIINAFDPNGGTYTVRLPVGEPGRFFVVTNAGATGTLNVVDASDATVNTLDPSQSSLLFASDSTWIGVVGATDVDVFGPVGAEHSTGLVPDPGIGPADPDPSNRRFLTELGTWATVTGLSAGNDYFKLHKGGAVTLTPTGSETLEFLSANSILTVLAQSGTSPQSILFTLNQGSIDHNALLNYSANRHIDHTAVTLTAGSGLSGGGDISASRTINLDLDDLTTDTPVLADTFGFYDTSGGDTNKATFTVLNGILDHNALLNYSANRHIDHTTVSIVASTGLSGGGDISTSRSLSVDINGLTEDTPATNDYLMFYDVSSGEINKALISSVGGGSPGGADTQIQFNDGGAFSGESGLTWDKTNNRLTVADLGTIGWGQYTRFAASTAVGALSANGSVSLGSSSGPFGIGNVVSPDYAALQLVTNGDTPYINCMFNAANSDGVWLRTSSTGAADPSAKNTAVSANSDVFFWDFVAAHEESSGFFSWNGIGLIRYSVDGTPAFDSLPSRFRIYVNSGKDGYDTRMDLRADGTNTFSSLITASATQNDITPVMVLQKTTDGTPGLGTGIDLRFVVETSAGNNEIGANIQAVTTDITASSEDFDLVFKTMAAGAAAAEVLRLKSTGSIAAGGQTITADAPLLDLSQTWNNAAVAFTGIKFNVTHTASHSDSCLMDLQAGGASRFKVGGGVFGNAAVITGYTGASLTIPNDAGLSHSSDFVMRGAGIGPYFSGMLAVKNSWLIGWSSSDMAGSIDVALWRDAAGILAQRNSTNPQTFRVYSSYTDASNYSRLAINGNQIASEVAGTGSLAVTASTPVLDLKQTVNNGAVTFVCSSMDITHTASVGTWSSRYFDYKVGGVVKLAANLDGQLFATSFYGHAVDSIAGSAHFTITDYASGAGITVSGGGAGLLGKTGVAGLFGWQIGETDGFGWCSSGSVSGGATDVVLYRDAAGILALRNSTNAQKFNIYNTYTDSSNYERGIASWSTNTNSFVIGTEAAGTGTARDVNILASSGSVFIAKGVANSASNACNVTLTNGLLGGDAIKLSGQNGYIAVSEVEIGGVSWRRAITFINSSNIAFSSTSALSGTADIGYSRAAAKVLDINDGTTGNVGYVRLNGVAVASLPTASATYRGCRGTVTDANSTTFLSTVAGGGSNVVPVFCDGTNWKIG